MFKKFFRKFVNFFRRKFKNAVIKATIKVLRGRVKKYERVWEDLKAKWEKEGLPKEHETMLADWVEEEFKKELRTALIKNFGDLKITIDEIFSRYLLKPPTTKLSKYIKWRLKVDYLERLREKNKNEKEARNFIKALELEEFVRKY